ncbi:MAG TPA: hypothetical protein VJB94_02890 [Candidatus Nanoarchaeia archaeon]|nr:hypothetical protein [Candidatus Nanoarchaeia archaeon]
MNIGDKSVKEGDLVLLLNKIIDTQFFTGKMFLYKEIYGTDGRFIRASRGIELTPAMNLGDIEMPVPRILDWRHNEHIINGEAEEIYLGLDEILEGLNKHKEFEVYAAVAQYYANLRPALSKF